MQGQAQRARAVEHCIGWGAAGHLRYLQCGVSKVVCEHRIGGVWSMG